MQSINQALALRLVACIAACGVLLCSLEYLTTRSLLSDKGLLSWPVHRLRYKLLTHGGVAALLSSMLAYPNVLGLLGIQSVLALLLLIGSLFNLLSVVVTLLFTSGIAFTLLLFGLRFPYGKEGADQMLIIIFVVLTFGYLFNTSIMFAACLWFLAAQACLSYSTAGIAKMISPMWRSGQALPAIMATTRFGHRTFYSWLQAHPTLTKLLTWITLGLEALFPLILLLPWWLSLSWLLWGFCFHISNAVLIRLNRFVWAFTATYPAIWYCVTTMHFLR